jgi:hypothetical protein
MASRLKRSTTDAGMAVKGFVEEGLAAGVIMVLISLDVKGAFDAAWCPSILNWLKANKCHKNLYNLSKSYLTNGLQSFHLTMQVFREQSPKGLYKDPVAGQGTGTSYTIPY